MGMQGTVHCSPYPCAILIGFWVHRAMSKDRQHLLLNVCLNPMVLCIVPCVLVVYRLASVQQVMATLEENVQHISKAHAAEVSTRAEFQAKMDEARKSSATMVSTLHCKYSPVVHVAQCTPPICRQDRIPTVRAVGACSRFGHTFVDWPLCPLSVLSSGSFSPCPVCIGNFRQLGLA